MDTTQINTVEWFFGYGGNHLGLKRVIRNMRLLAACEIEGYAVANLVSKMEAGLLDVAPVWTDAKTFPSSSFHGLVDLFIASYPCQGFSCAGKRQGSRDPRFLWPWVFRFVCEARPRVVFFENVEGHVSLGLSTVISDLEEAGYAVEAGIFSAAECGAAHRRKRVFIMGHDNEHGRPSETFASWQPQFECASVMANAPGVGEREPHDEERSEPRDDARENSGGRSDELGDTKMRGLEEQRLSERETPEIADTQLTDSALFWPSAPARPGEPQHAWEPPRVIQTIGGLGGGSNGRAANVDRLRLLGNGVVPACAAKAFVTLAAKLIPPA